MTKNVSVPEGYKKTKLGVIPENWEVKPLGEYAKLQGGFAFKSKDSAESGARWLKIANVGIGSIKWDVESYLPLSFIEDYPEYILKKGQIVMAMTRPVLSDKLKITKLKETDVPSLLNQRVGRLVPTNNLDSEYLYQVARDIYFLEEIKLKIRGTDPPNISSTHIESIKIAVPPLPEQQKIASILSKVDEQIEQTEQIIEKTEILKKGLMQKLLTKGIGHTKFKKTEFGEIPEEWSIEKLGVLCELITKGTTPTTVGFSYQNTGINFVKIESISASGNFLLNMFSHISEDANNALKRSILKDRDLLFSIAGALGRVAIVNSEILPANTNQALAIIRLKEDQKTDIKYVYFYLKGPQIQKHIDRINVQSAQANLSLENINNFKIALPQKEEQQKIASILSKIDSHIQDNKSYLHKLQELKKGLMQDLLTGKVRV